MARKFAEEPLDTLSVLPRRVVKCAFRAGVTAAGRSASEFLGSPFCKRSVSSVPTSVALRMSKRESSALVSAYGSSPRDTLPRVFAQSKRAARQTLSMRISERLAVGMVNPGRVLPRVSV